MADVSEQIENVRTQADTELAGVRSVSDLEQFRIKFLGSNGQIKSLMKLLGQVPREEKPAIGQRVNKVKDQVTAAFEEKKASLAASGSSASGAGVLEDVTEPGKRPQIGNQHILMK